MLKVVIIDNSAISRNLLSTILVNGGHDVVGDSNTSSAGLARMIKLRPQLVFIDIGSEDTNDITLITTLREAAPKALLFLVSAKISEGTAQAAIEHGIHGFIVKPFNSATVLATIRNTILKVARQHKASTTA